ncbi:DNA-binding SARP family transcriptional activator [Nocardia kruczakiae]|uniref:DNA-binding SARP family transcriptional activator n=1 Tax=Nocardia kruczakiae TaxID=261477 RepID=A0ABU1X8W1_9NOCA|nr:BTAD domain-containing putative transcriptional regulator [Nocardia kruczakiae]MDR7166526.1 DNA-binding SARP family transcriptional activator [Nocardia kruczakiae]
MSAQLTDPDAAPSAGVLGPVRAVAADGTPLPLHGPRHAEVLARLIAAGGRVVPVPAVVGDLWEEPPPGAVAAVRTFVAALRRALEPGRAPRTPSRVIVTEGTGYRLMVPRDHVDAWSFDDLVRAAANQAGPARMETLETALALWRGEAYGDYRWARGEAARLGELRSAAVEMLAEARIRQGRPEQAVAELESHLHAHPARERAWLLQARGLWQAGRREDALAALRRARTRLGAEAGLDPSAELIALEREILTADTAFGEHRLWRETVAASGALGPRSRLTSSADLLRGLALTDATGLMTAQDRRARAIDDLSVIDDPELTATALTRMEVPGVWSVLDDPARSARVAEAARTTLERLDAEAAPALRARLLALFAVETRGRRGTSGAEAARAAERIARDLGDPSVLVLALDARFLQSFHAPGRWPMRARLAHELITVSSRHDLSTYLILGHLVAMQAAAAVGDVAAADEHAAAADRLAVRYERDLVGVFTTWYRALRTVLTDRPEPEVADAYERALDTLPGCGMPGVATGLAPLTRLCLALRAGRDPAEFDGVDFGPNTPYVAALIRPGHAHDLLHAAPAPPPDHLAELRWALLGIAADRSADRETARHAHRTLSPARGELLGAGTGILSLGPADVLLDRWEL